MTRLGINIDHVATLRQARKEGFPDPVQLALEAIQGGADGITAHLREDRRHIQDDDIRRLKESIQVPLNMEMSVNSDVISRALIEKPHWACLVPERREELTTEGGLDVLGNKTRVESVVGQLKNAGIRVSLFIDPQKQTVQAAKDVGADAIEIHTGKYSRYFNEAFAGARSDDVFIKTNPLLNNEIDLIEEAAHHGKSVGLLVNAGHGIDYRNVHPLLKRFEFNELNIGFAIIARALTVGLMSAVQEMKEKMRNL